MKHVPYLVGVLSLLAASAGAQITPIAPFPGDATEGFESQPMQSDVACIQPRIFGDRGDLCSLQGATLGVASGFGSFGTIFSHSGNHCAGSGIGGAVFTFDAPVQSFGGFFGTVAGSSGGTAVFYDAGGNTIGTQPITVSTCTLNCVWTWNGWDAGGGPRIKSVWVNSSTGTGAGLAFDDMVATYGAPATGTYYCSGDGSTTACPCGNASTNPPRGCVNSSGDGARLTAGGIASLANDTVVLYASEMGPIATHLFFQGTNQVGFGGQPFGDGLRCAGGQVVRLARHAAIQGTSQYPIVNELPIHVRGQIATPGIRTYQVWYRDVAPLCFPIWPFNTTNAYQIVWAP